MLFRGQFPVSGPVVFCEEFFECTLNLPVACVKKRRVDQGMVDKRKVVLLLEAPAHLDEGLGIPWKGVVPSRGDIGKILADERAS